MRSKLTRALIGAFAGIVAIGASYAIPTYVWCPASRSVHLASCCGHHEGVQAPCCEPRSDEHQDATVSTEHARVMTPALAPIAVIVPPIALASIAPAAPLPIARAGPSRLRARLSVYRL